MQEYQNKFIQLAIEQRVLCFGEFTLKSGRKSPYFFNAGKFSTGEALSAVGRAYAAAIMHHAASVEFDMLFGPAYKGISLTAATAIALNDQYQKSVPYAFNRKEAKDHGEGGTIIGAPLTGRVLIIDDVITAGTAVREVVSLIRDAGAEVAGVMIGLNRQERGVDGLSAVQEVERNYQIAVNSIVTLDDVIGFLEHRDICGLDMVEQIKFYRKQYGV